MKVLTRAIAVLMVVAMLACLMAACGKPASYKDENIIGTWKQTDEEDGNWTWTFNDDFTCKLVGDDGFNSEGTYRIEDETTGKIHITLNDWPEEHLFSYVATTKAMDLTSMDLSYHCLKQ